MYATSPGELPLPFKEYPLVRNKDVLKDDRGIIDVHAAANGVIEQVSGLTEPLVRRK